MAAKSHICSMRQIWGTRLWVDEVTLVWLAIFERRWGSSLELRGGYAARDAAPAAGARRSE
jgi:hypothetical protein